MCKEESASSSEKESIYALSPGRHEHSRTGKVRNSFGETIDEVM